VNSERFRRGSSFIFFVACIVPLTLVALTLAADFSKIILESQKAQTVADAAARAAATAIREDGTFRTCVGEVNCPKELAESMYAYSANLGLVEPGGCQTVSVITTGKDIEVTIRYKVTGLTLINMFGSTSSVDCLTAQGTARICQGQSGGGNECLYPGAN
jgi:uncharacterized membrane protein